ncbi:MAG: GH116 family glycosyl-hydrolase [Thermaerobacter sp.]|nr:GH116 family glycosyl-hydrolase [Thermaerobacter sp.]
MSNQVGEYDPGHTTAVVFPLGGIGTGSIGLAGNGRLVEFEIQNRPNKNSSNGFSFFAIKAEHAHQVRTAKILNGDLEGTHSGEGRSPFVGFGFGPPREALAGLPHYAQWHFTGRFPVAQIAFADQDRMLDVTLSAFNPFVPLNSEDSSLPVALFTFDITNCSAAIKTACWTSPCPPSTLSCRSTARTPRYRWRCLPLTSPTALRSRWR